MFDEGHGSQFTSTDFNKVLAAREIRLGMDGKGAWRDHVFVERLWQTIEHADVCLRAHAGVSEARAGIGRYLGFTTAAVPIRRLTGIPRIGPASTGRCPRRWRRNQGGKPRRNRPEPVQTSRTTSPETRAPMGEEAVISLPAVASDQAAPRRRSR